MRIENLIYKMVKVSKDKNEMFFDDITLSMESSSRLKRLIIFFSYLKRSIANLINSLYLYKNQL